MLTPLLVLAPDTRWMKHRLMRQVNFIAISLFTPFHVHARRDYYTIDVPYMSFSVTFAAICQRIDYRKSDWKIRFLFKPFHRYKINQNDWTYNMQTLLCSHEMIGAVVLSIISTLLSSPVTLAACSMSVSLLAMIRMWWPDCRIEVAIFIASLISVMLKFQ